MVIKIEFGKTLDEYMSKFGEAHNNGELWDFDAKEFGDGSIELDPNIVYWKIGDRIYETTVLNIEYNVTSAVRILRESTTGDLERSINKWLAANDDITLQDIKCVVDTRGGFTAIIIYEKVVEQA